MCLLQKQGCGTKKLSWDPYDIEELHQLAKEHQLCPYFANKDRSSGADIIFMPYNYLIDEKIRENFEIKLPELRDHIR